MLKNLILAAVAFTIVAAPAVAAQEGTEEGSGYEPSLASMMAEVEKVGRVDVTVSSKQVAFDWSGIQIGPNMSGFVRSLVDKFGNQDGAVDADELETGEAMLRTFVKQQMTSMLTNADAGGYFLIDRNNAYGVDVTDLITEGLIGPVNSSQPVSLAFRAAFGFEPPSKDVHTVTLDMGKYYFRGIDEEKAQSVAGDFVVRVAGGDGWSIDADSLGPDCVAEAWDGDSGAIVLDSSHLDCFTGHSGLLLGFTISGGDDGGLLPGLELPLLVLGLAGVAVVLRRRQ